MSDQVDKIISQTGQQMSKSLEFLNSELLKIRAGKASTNMIDDIKVEYYGNPTPLNQVANVSLSDSRTLLIQPWEKSIIKEIEKAILTANIGITPQNDGQSIRLTVPPLTEDRRKELVKKVNGEGENGKISIRNIRRDAIEQIKKLQKDGLSEDESKSSEARIQGITDKHIEKVDEICKQKEKEIMTI